MRVCVLSHFNRVQLFATLWTVAHHTPLSMGFSRQKDWSGCRALRQGPSQPRGHTHFSFVPALAGRLFTTNITWEDPLKLYSSINRCLGMGCISVACVGFNLLM